MRGRIDHGHDVLTLQSVLSPAECVDWIARAHREGFRDAPITTPAGPMMAPGIRDNTRVIFDDPAVAEELFGRMAERLPQTDRKWHLAGLNERFRVYRYTDGQRFRWHRDGCYMRPRPTRESRVERSTLSLLIYLSDGFEGGDTEFRVPVRVTPVAGEALAFPHELVHQGAPVTKGIKYVLRTDVMYRRS